METAIEAIAVLDQGVPALVEAARAIRITTENELRAANEFLRVQCKALRAEIASGPGLAKSAAWESYQVALAVFNRYDKPAEEAERIVKLAISTYSRQRREEAEREIAERRKAAQKLAEDERLARAVLLENQNRGAEAVALLEKPLAVPAMAASRAVPKMEGTSITTTWRGEVTDFAELVKAAAADPQYLNLLLPNGPAINALAKAMKSNLRVPGLLAVESDTVRSRA
jgi:hypothetical protein